jgi:hypothetical protein
MKEEGRHENLLLEGVPGMNADTHEMFSGSNVTPIPDPTLLTTQQLIREILSLRELLEAKQQAFSRETDMRFAGLNKEIIALQELHSEKFAAVARQFDERDTRALVTAEAIDKAMQKSEGATTKQMDQLYTLIATGTKTLDDKITDIKERLALSSGTGSGLKQGWGILLGAIAGGVGLLTMFAFLK